MKKFIKKQKWIIKDEWWSAKYIISFLLYIIVFIILEEHWLIEVIIFSLIITGSSIQSSAKTPERKVWYEEIK